MPNSKSKPRGSARRHEVRPLCARTAQAAKREQYYYCCVKLKVAYPGYMLTLAYSPAQASSLSLIRHRSSEIEPHTSAHPDVLIGNRPRHVACASCSATCNMYTRLLLYLDTVACTVQACMLQLQRALRAGAAGLTVLTEARLAGPRVGGSAGTLAGTAGSAGWTQAGCTRSTSSTSTSAPKENMAADHG